MLDPAAERAHRDGVVSKAIPISNRYLWNNFDFNQVKRTWTEWNGFDCCKTEPEFFTFLMFNRRKRVETDFLSRKNNRTV